MKKIKLFALFMTTIFSYSYEQQVLLNMLSSNDKSQIKESIRYLNETAQSKISGNEGDTIDQILLPARDYLEPYKNKLITLDFYELPEIVYLLGLTKPNKEVGEKLFQIMNDPNSNSQMKALAITSIISLEYKTEPVKAYIKNVLKSKDDSNLYYLAANAAIKWKWNELTPLIQEGVHAKNKSIQYISNEVLINMDREINNSYGASISLNQATLPEPEPEIRSKSFNTLVVIALGLTLVLTGFFFLKPKA